MTASKARAILAEAKQRDTYEGPIPEDDEKAISEAEALVKMATTAWEQKVRGPEVEAILRLAAEEETESEAPQEDAEPEVEIPAPEEQPRVEITTEPQKEIDYIFDLTEYSPLGAKAAKDYIVNYSGVLSDEKEKSAFLSLVWKEEHKREYVRQGVVKLIENLAGELPNEGDLPVDSDPEEIQGEESTETTEDRGSEEANAERRGLDPVQADVNEREKSNPGLDVEGSTDGGLRVETPEAPVGDSVDRVSEVSEGPEPDHSGNSEEEDVDKSGDDSEGDFEYNDLINQVERELQQSRLHVPAPPQDEPPNLPYDYSRVTDGELRSLHSVFSMYAYRANYLLMREERVAALLRQAADELARELLVAANKYDDKGKEKRVAVLEAEIESDPMVKRLRKVQRKHEIFATAHRQERDSYNKLVESMSRLESMRQNEWERSRR